MICTLAADSYAQKFVAISNHRWMVENLDVASFQNGDPITHAVSDEEWKAAAAAQKPVWCHYRNETSNGAKYGILYNWYAVADSRKLCPEGWRVPEKQDWLELNAYLGSDAGMMLKSGSGWSDEGNGSSKSPFQGFPAGRRYPSGAFQGPGLSAVWWSSTAGEAGDDAWSLGLSARSENPTVVANDRGSGFSVRCITEIGELGDSDQIFTVVEETASPKGGMAAFYKHIGSQLKYPAVAIRSGVEGKVYVEFIVNHDGSLSDATVVRGIGGGCDEEAVRLIESAPAWNPGKQRGKTVRQKYTLPIQFKLQ